jgi:hypothetical protein
MAAKKLFKWVEVDGLWHHINDDDLAYQTPCGYSCIPMNSDNTQMDYTRLSDNDNMPQPMCQICNIMGAGMLNNPVNEYLEAWGHKTCGSIS